MPVQADQMDAAEGDVMAWSDGVQRELQRLAHACEPERLPPVLELPQHQWELGQRAEAPVGGAPEGFGAPSGTAVAVPRSELDDADAVALSAHVRTVADRNDLVLLAHELTRRSSDPVVQARAIFRWVADAIAFDASAAELPPQDATAVLARRTAAGDGHAKLVEALGQHANLRVSCVYGHGRSRSWRFAASDEKHSDSAPPVNHCWNALYAGNRWHLLDAAWAAGSVTSDGRFCKAFDEAYWLPLPPVMAVTHKPVLSGWQMLAAPITDEQYRHSVPRGAAFFRHGLELLSHPLDGTVRCGQRVDIVLGHAPDVPIHFTCVLVEERVGEVAVVSDGWPHDCCLIETHESLTCVHVTAPPKTEHGTGRWELRIMAAPGAGLGGYVEDTYRSMEWCVSYQLDFGRCMGTPLPSRFPYVARGATVIAPTCRGIESGRVRFRIRWSGPAAPSNVAVVVPGIATATPLGSLQAVPTTIAGETQFYGVVDVSDPDVDIVQVEADFHTATGTKKISLAEYCLFVAEQPQNILGRELRTRGLGHKHENISRPTPVAPSTLQVETWDGIGGRMENQAPRRPPIDISALQAFGEVFSDVDFSPESGCLCHDVALLRETVREDVADQWARVAWSELQVVPRDMAPGVSGQVTLYAIGARDPEPLFPADTENAWRNIIGGVLGDCAFLSCLTALSEDMRLIRRIFVNMDEFASTRAIVTRLTRRGEAVEILVDGAMPVLQYAATKEPLPAFCHASDCLWPALLQKAYAKLRGSYQQALGDSPSFILQALTGAPSVAHPLIDDDDAIEEIWEELLHAMEKNYIVCACAAEQTGVNLPPKQEAHTYAVLQVRDIPELDQQLVMLRNPLAHAWNQMGAEIVPTMLQDNPHKRDDEAERWPPELCEILGVDSNLQSARNGVFWVNLKDMHCFFESIVVNKSSGGQNYHSATSRLDCHTTIGGGTAFYVLEVDEPSIGDAVVAVTQHSSRDIPDCPALSFVVLCVSTGKEIGSVGPTAAEMVSLECSFDKTGDYYVVVDMVSTRDESQQIVLGVTAAGNPRLSAVPESVALGEGMQKIVARNGQKGANGFCDRDSYFKHGLGGVSMTSWGTWSPAHLRYWQFLLHENAEHAHLSEVLQFNLENMEIFREAQPWVAVGLESKQRNMIVLQSVGQASLTAEFQIASRKLQLESRGGTAPDSAVEDLSIVDEEPPAQGEVEDTWSEVQNPVHETKSLDGVVPELSNLQRSDENRRQPEIESVHAAAEQSRLGEQAHTATETEHERLQAQAAARLEKHKRDMRNHQQLQDARAEELGLRLELERRDKERDKLKEASMGYSSHPVIPAVSSAPGAQTGRGISDQVPNTVQSDKGAHSKDRSRRVPTAGRATKVPDATSQATHAAKLESRARKRAQQNEERAQRKVHEANVMREQARAKQNSTGDSWEQVGDLAKREAERILRREYLRKEKHRKDRERRVDLRRQKQLAVLQMKASMHLNNWEQMHAKMEADNASQAKAAAARYMAQQQKKIQRDEFERKKKGMLEEQRRKAEDVKRQKWKDSERRRKDAQASKEADARAFMRAQKIPTALTSEPAKRAAAIENLPEQLRKFFGVADTDGDGSLSTSELAALLKNDDSVLALLKDAGMKPAFIFRQLDTDGDQTISFLEFLKVMDVHLKTIQDGSSKTSVLDSLAGIAAGDVAVLSNNTMELRMRLLLEQQTRKEAKDRAERAADIARQIVQEDANQRMRQSMKNFDEKRKTEFTKIEENAKERRRVLVDKQRTYQNRLRDMKQKQSSRSEPFFLASTNATLPKHESTPGQRFICEQNATIRKSMLSDRSLRQELQAMDLHLLKKRVAAAGIATEQLSSTELVDALLVSNRVGTLKVGDEVVALEERVNEDNVLQIRTTRGWIALESTDGSTNLRLNHTAWVPTGSKLAQKQSEQASGRKHPSSSRLMGSRKSAVSYDEIDSEMHQEGFVESNPDATSYQVEFSTGDTGDIIGDLYLRLQGTLASSKTVLCSNIAWTHCTQSSRCSFIFKAPWLGQIRSVAVGHNVGQSTHDRSTRMLLSNVVVKHVDTGTVWRFPCQQWLDDISRMCVIPEAGSAISDGGHNAARSISYSGARVAFTTEEDQKLHRITIRLRAIAPETTSVPVTVDLEGKQRGEDYVKTVQLSFQIPDTTYPTTVETVGKFQCSTFGPMRTCAIRDITGACSGLGSKVHVYVDCVMVEVEGTSSSWYFDFHRWLDIHSGAVAAGPAPRGLEAVRLTHPSKRGLVEQIRDMTTSAPHVPAPNLLSEEHAATWRDVAEWAGDTPRHSNDGIASDATDRQRVDAAISRSGTEPAATAAASGAASAGQLPSATEAELLHHHRVYQEGQSLVEGEDMVYVVRFLSGDEEAAKALRQTFRSAPPTVALTLFGTHGPPMIVNVPITFVPYSEERFIVRVQQYHGILQGVRVRIDDTIPGAPALPFKWNLLSLTVTDIRRMQTWHSTCRSVFQCSNSVTAALLRPTATGRSAAHRITLVLGPGTTETAPHSRLQVFITGVGGEGSVALIASPWTHHDCTLSTRGVLRCPEAWLPYLGDQLELGLCQCDDAATTASVYVSQVIVVRDGVEMRFRLEREITAGAVHYGTLMKLPQVADLLKLDGGNVPVDPLRVDPIPLAEFVLRLHLTETCLLSSIDCWIGYWSVEPNSSKFAIAWSPTLLVAKDAAYYAARESYEFPLRLPSPGAELWGIKIKAQGSSWGVGFVELVDQASREVYSCNCDGAPLVREELPDGTKFVSRELVFATKQPLEHVSRDPKLSPWEEWKQDQARRADAAAERERRAAAHRGALEMGVDFARKAARAARAARGREAEEQHQEAAAREREARRKAAQELLDKQMQEAKRRQQQEAARVALEEEQEAARLRVEAAERAAEDSLSATERLEKSNLERVMEETYNEFSEMACAEALALARDSVPDAIMRLQMSKRS